MSKIEKYRIISGILQAKDFQIPFNFGLVFEDNGIYTVEFHVPETFSLRDYNDKNWEYRNNLTAFCITEEKNKLEIRGLNFRTISFTYSKIILICNDCLIHTEINFYDEPNTNKSISASTPLHYIEFEGLEMEFCDHTEIEETKWGTNKSSKTTERDHTSSLLHTEFSSYSQIFFKPQQNSNIVADFTADRQTKLTYEKYLEFKKDYISFLAFLNGASVKIRREYTGDSLKIGKNILESDITIIYSFEKFTNKRHNNYIPLNERLTNVPDNILGKAFIFSFDKFREWNKKIDLSSIIYYLNTIEKINTAEERFFIQIIAFERLSKLYSKYGTTVDDCIPNSKDFEEIKNEFYSLLEKYKIEFGNNFNKAKGLLGNLNKSKISTTAKMYKILTDVNITINDEISKLIENVRNNIVHEGDIGSGIDGIKNMHLLNEILHEIILRLIEYKGIRYNKYIPDPDNYIYK